MKLSTQSAAFSTLVLAPTLCLAAPAKPKLKPAAKPQSASQLPRQRLNFNANWRFHKGDTGGGSVLGQGYALQKWRWKSSRDLSALTENISSAEWKDAGPTTDVFGQQLGFAWFRTTLAPQAVTAQMPPILHFSGVDDNAKVYLNGKEIFVHRGYGVPFDVPLSANWKTDAPNELAVLVENTAGPGLVGEVGLQIGPPIPSRASQATFNDKVWRVVNLPHDWGIEGPFQQELPGETGKLPWMGIGWYRKSFSLPKSDAGKKIYLDIDGAMSYSTVWLNGQSVGGWPYGYASYRVDLTPFLKIGGENVLAIRLDNPAESSRWYPGGGIYRNTWLVKTAPVHVAHWGMTVTTPEISPTSATVNVAVNIEKPQSGIPVAVHTDIFAVGAKGERIGSSLASARTAANAANLQQVKLQIRNPKLWNTKNPQLYMAVTSLLQNGKVVDTYSTTFGVRTIKWDAVQGLLVNGERVKIQGVCMHHDMGALGTAINVRALERQIQILQEMGCNAIRTSHNPPAPELLDLCDRMGMLVMDEFTDSWTRPKKRNGYTRLFDEWAEKDVRALVRRDRNHPSVMLWSSGNEIPEQSDPVNGAKISQRLTDIFHEEDPTRLVSMAISDTRAGYSGFQKTLDVMGFNYRPGEYGRFRAAEPNMPLFGSETSSTTSSRGEYFFPFTNNKNEGKSDFQISSYDIYSPGWASLVEDEFRGQDRNPSVAGEFVWTGFDYLGEPTPYSSDSTNLLNYHTPEARAAAEKELQELGRIKVPSRSSYFGIVDLAGFKKDRFYLYQARWRPELKMAHILPHWNWPERVGQVTPVHVYTSGDEAELFLNGKSLGRKKKEALTYRLRWDDVVYEPGELRVVTYKNGQLWAEDVVKTTGAVAKIKVRADRNTLAADGHDLSFVTVSLLDANGLMVPRSKNRLKFEISGPAEIVATDNGDATDHTSFQSKERNAYNGMALVIIRTKAGQKGQIRLRATSSGLSGAETILTSR